MIVVAAAGGGVRAAYWTASVLGAIQDRSKGSFARQLFAISAVSGGALGGAAFAALGADSPTCQVKDGQSQSFHNCLSAFLSYDFLSPVMASALTGDLFQALTGIPLVDRAAALERTWETAWKGTFLGANWMEKPFDEPWRTGGIFHTNLLLNGTIADAGESPSPDNFPNLRPGERAVTSNLMLVQHLDAGDTPIANPAERRRISLSTAIDNSTRFPFVEPLGAVPPKKLSEVPPTYYVADGGYYDNYGAATLLDLLHLLNSRADKLSINRLIILQISSNSQVSFRLDRQPAPKSEVASDCRSKGESGGSASGVMAAYRTAMAAREWSGLAYAMELRALEGRAADPVRPRPILKNLEIKYFHFGLHDIDPPLGWSLSETSRGCIDGLLQKNGHVDGDIQEVVSLLDEH